MSQKHQGAQRNAACAAVRFRNNNFRVSLRPMALHAQHFPLEFKANDCSYLRDAAFITETRAACCAAEDTWGLVVTPIWPAMLDCDLPDPDAAAMTCWRDECCAAALKLELFAAPRWPATCWRFIFDAEEVEEEAAFCSSNRRAFARCSPRNLECCLVSYGCYNPPCSAVCEHCTKKQRSDTTSPRWTGRLTGSTFQ